MLVLRFLGRKENEERIRKEQQRAEFEQRQMENRRREEEHSRRIQDSLRAMSVYASNEVDEEDEEDDCSEEEYQKYLAEQEAKKKKDEFEANKAALEKEIKGIEKSPKTITVVSGGISLAAFSTGWVPVLIALLYCSISGGAKQNGMS